jgi:hypothetical protein
MTYDIQKVVNVRSFMYKKSDRMAIDGDLDGEVVRCPRFHCIPGHSVMMRMDERLVQIEHQRLTLDQAEAVPRDRRQWVEFIFDRLMLYKLIMLVIKFIYYFCENVDYRGPITRLSYRHFVCEGVMGIVV